MKSEGETAMVRMFAIACLAAGALTASAPALAQPAGSRQTREFVEAAGQSDQFEILEARTALTQSADPAVRAFAQQMIQAHTDTGHALEQATQRAGLQPPSKSLSGDQAQLLNALQSQRGADFDRTYARHQMLAHRSALVVEQRYATSGDVPALRQVAASTTPIITSHLAMADQLQSRLGGP